MKQFRKLLSSLLIVCILVTISSVNVFAQNTNDAIDNLYSKPIFYSSLEEFTEANTEELEAQEIQIIGGRAYEIEQTDPITRARYTVWIDWNIGYSASSKIGLESYLKAYSTNTNCLLKKVNGVFNWDDLSTYAQGGADIGVTLIVPTYQIYSAHETGKTFPSGTKVKCDIYGDVDAISEISGGTFDYTDTVTIP